MMPTYKHKDMHQLMLNFSNEGMDLINQYREIVSCSNTSVINRVLTVFCKHFDSNSDYDRMRDFINENDYSDMLTCTNEEFRKKYHQKYIYIYISDENYHTLVDIFNNQNYATNLMRFISLIVVFTMNLSMSYLINYNNDLDDKFKVNK